MSTSSSGSGDTGTPPRQDASAAPYAAASAGSGHYDTRTAGFEVAEQLQDAFAGISGGRCDLLLVFASYHHCAAFGEAGQSIRETLRPQVMLGVTGEAVIGGDEEMDGRSGLTAIAMRFGETGQSSKVRLHTFTTGPANPMPLRDPAGIRERLGMSDANDKFRTAIFFADPFTTPIARLLPAMSNCGEEKRNGGVPIVGGLASGATQPGINVLLLNDQVINAGGVGVSIFGDVGVDFVVSQGCRPFGKPHVVTKAHQNVILELGSRKALDVLRETAEQLPDDQKQLLAAAPGRGGGVLIGTVINEYKERFGRGDFLVRNILGIDQNSGGIAVGELPRVGQTVQFHLRDAATAAEDLQLLLDAQQLDVPPFASLLFSCNGRGARLFGESGHDLRLIHDRLGNAPTAGFFAAGELGPIGKHTFLHGHTASIALFREGH